MPATRHNQPFKVYIKNESSAPVHLDELVYDLAPGEEIDPCDAALPVHYRDPAAPLKVMDNVDGLFDATTLYQAYHQGKVTRRLMPLL